MSDHIDGPRTIADPSIDLTDLFAFKSPADQNRLVLIADVFPFAGETGVFSNAANYNIIVRRVQCIGLGSDAGFDSYGPELRFTFQFQTLSPAASTDTIKQQRGVCVLPNGESIDVLVGDENGSYSKDRAVRVFAGVRSDPFYIGWVLNTLKSVPNYLEDDNVMGLVIELDLNQFLPKGQGSLFGVIAETAPKNHGPQTLNVPRYDWVGRPEQTNFIINAIPNSVDLRDLWNQQTPFGKLPSDVDALFRSRLRDSFEFWDKRDDQIDWNKSQLAAHANVRMKDFLIFDLDKPINDHSHLEIEQSTIAGKPYTTGGGRTIDANVIDILVTYLINRNQGKFYQSMATQATQKGLQTFPYLAPPNKKLLNITHSTLLAAHPTLVWSVIGKFDALWNPLIASLKSVGSGVGQLREMKTVDGKLIVERLEAIDNSRMVLEYSLIAGIPAKPLRGIVHVSGVTQGTRVTWSINYRPSGQGELIVRLIINTLVERGIHALRERFGALKDD